MDPVVSLARSVQHIRSMCRSYVALLAILGSGCLAFEPSPEDEPIVGSDSWQIINGDVTTQYPAAGVLMFGPDRQTADTGCTATLVGCRTVLTAAHCVCPREDIFNPNCAVEPRIMFFQHAGFYEIENIAVHPGYQAGNGIIHDVAVATLAQPVSGITPVPIQTEAPGLGPATAVGFGRTSDQLVDYGIKRSGQVDMVTCTSPESNTEHICWSGPTDLCNGDSGGPLFIGEGAAMRTAGISSYVPGGCGADNVDMNVATNKDFIEGQAGADLVATECVPTQKKVGEEGVTVQGQSGNLAGSGETALFEVMVPEGTSELRITLNGHNYNGTQNAPALSNFNLLVKHGSPPAGLLDGDCISDEESTTGHCQFDSPLPGTYYIEVRSVTGSGDFQVTWSVFDDAPIAQADSYGSDPGTTLTVPSSSGVLINDMPSSRGALSAELVDQPEHGSVELSADGSFVFSPDGDYSGPDSFTYVASDGTYHSAPTEVTLDVGGGENIGNDHNLQGGCQSANSSTPGWLGGLLLIAGFSRIRSRRRRRA